MKMNENNLVIDAFYKLLLDYFGEEWFGISIFNLKVSLFLYFHLDIDLVFVKDAF